MAITVETTIRRYIGLHSDTKPTGVPEGSLFWEYDTGDTYKTRNGTNWSIYTGD